MELFRRTAPPQFANALDQTQTRPERRSLRGYPGRDIILDANYPRKQGPAGPYRPDFRAVIEADDGAVIMMEWHGYGRAYPPRRSCGVGTDHAAVPAAGHRASGLVRGHGRRGGA